MGSLLYVWVTRAHAFTTGDTALLKNQIPHGEHDGRWTMTGNLTRELGLDRGERCDELGQVMYI
jgi:hypothetical protein